MIRRTAFRLYGNFQWPPLPEGGTDRRKGTVEIFYVEDGSDLCACAQWSPHGVPDEDMGEPPFLASLGKAAMQAAIGDGSKPFAFRLGKPPTGPELYGERIVFRGAGVFDQYGLSPDGSESLLDQRWLLARGFLWERDYYESGIGIGDGRDNSSGGGTSFSLRLALAAPRAQSLKGGRVSYAVPFRARYRPRIAQNMVRGEAVPATFFAAGPDGNNGEKKLVDTPVADHRLGHFGFCKTDGGSMDFFYPRGSGDPKRYWPSDTATLIADAFGKLGAIAPDLANCVSLTPPHTPGGEKWNSIRFFSDSAETRISFRTAIFAAAAGGESGDIAVENIGSTTAPDYCFKLRDPRNPARWLLTYSRQLFLDLELGYSISDEDIWAAMEEDGWRASLRIRLGFPANVKASCGIGDLFSEQPDAREFTVNQLLDSAIKAMRLARLDLQNIEAGLPQSALPEIRLTEGHRRFAFCAKLDAQIHAGGEDATKQGEDTPPAASIDWGRTKQRRRQWPGADFRLSLCPENRIIGSQAEGSGGEIGEIKATLQLPSLAAEAGEAASIVIAHHDFAYDAADDAGGGPFCTFRLAPPKTSLPVPPIDFPQLRLGGFGFQPNAYFLLEETGEAGLSGDFDEASHWYFSTRKQLRAPRKEDGTSHFYWSADVDLRLRLSIGSVLPLGVDIPRDERDGRVRPLLIRLDDGQGGGRYFLDLKEQVGASIDRRLTADLFDNGDGAGSSGDHVVLSTHPFSITKFRSQPLQDRGDPFNSAVATYDSDTRRWALKTVGAHYHYEFPPQSIGESADKPRRLEIIDQPKGVAGFVRPYEPDADGVARRRAVEFRLTPSAELWVRPTDVERGYFLPEWAGYDLFRQYGALGLGAAVAAFRAEFLYGLPVGIDTSRESGPARGARVAEIEALLGRPAGPIRGDAESSRKRRWNALSNMIARRPERLEMWMRDPDSLTPFTPARFRDGVRFALRDTAVHNLPIDDPERLDPARTAGPRLLPHGLSGGALWPIESANFCALLIARPESNGGTIERIALSPTGGDADQRAEFLNGQLAIISETRNGHVQRHRVEIIGRISVFWHRAKHVVVYERTTNPGAQFTPDGGIGDRTRRPVLRKVSEYIELLQPVRAYPDFAAQEADKGFVKTDETSAGFLRSVRFNQKTINVDSAWSEDVGQIGWKIPLWNRHSAVQRPSVYPRPDIVFVTAAEGEGEAPVAAQECLDPDNIYFFADASDPEGNADTDRWPERLGIDYTNLPAPAHKYQPRFADSGQDGRRAPSPPRVPRGYRRFTWLLAEPARKTAMNAGRGDEPLFAGLETITFMRASHANAPELPIGQRMKEAAGTLGAAPLQAAGAAMERFRAVVADSPDDDKVKAAANDLVARLDKIDRTALDYHAKLVDLGALAANAGGRCDKLVTDFKGSLQRKKLPVLDFVRSWEAKATDLIDLGDNLPTVDEVAKKAAAELIKLVRPALDGAYRDIGNLKAGVVAARQMVRDFQAAVETALRNGERRLDEVRASYDLDKPWSPSRIDEYHRRLDEVRQGAIAEIESALADVQHRLATEIDATSQQIVTALAPMLRRFVEQGTAFGQLARMHSTAAESFIWTLHDNIDGGTAKLDQALGKAIDALKDPGHKAKVEDVRRKLHALRAHPDLDPERLAALATTLRGKANAIEAAIAAAKKTFDALPDVIAFATDAKAVLDDIEAEVKTTLLSGIGALDALAKDLIYRGAQLGEVADWFVQRSHRALTDALGDLAELPAEAFREIDAAAAKVQAKLTLFAETLKPDTAEELLRIHVLTPAIRNVLEGVDLAHFNPVSADGLKILRERVRDLSQEVESRLGLLDQAAAAEIAAVATAASALCAELGTSLEDAYKKLEALAKPIKDAIDALTGTIRGALADANALRNLAGQAEEDFRKIGADLSASCAQATAYTDRVFEAAGGLTDGGVLAAPGNILRLYAAAASAPALPNLDFARERLNYYYKEINKVIDTTPAEAWFGRLGDELKAMGIGLPFDQIGNGIIPQDLSKFDIGRVFRNFGGIDLGKMFRGFKLSKDAKDAVRITHAFDKKQYRAWVQIDVNLPLPNRSTLFAIGPFQMDFVNSRMTGTLRIEASKDSDKVEQTGRARIDTDIDAVVAGQSMVMLQKVGLNYERSSGLKVDFDPKNIRMNPSFRFIQETLAGLFPDELGGLKIVKQDGIPIGVEHVFMMPPISLMGVTSGVSNISISNRFALIAYPDFLIADRFSLSRPDLPFLFSIFIIGGTGYITVDCEYRPFDGELMVVVEAAAGGSAALGFALGPVSGLVFITLSIALAYRKRIGKAGGGLTMSVVLLIAGNVDVAGIATVYISLMLRMAYHENGRIDGVGTLSVKVRVCRFYTYRFRRNVEYKLRGGSKSSGGTQQLAAPAAAAVPPAAANRTAVKDRAKALLEARG